MKIGIKGRDTIEKRSGRWLKELARQSLATGFDLNARIPAWKAGRQEGRKAGSSGRLIPGRN
jgi:hypothetical protein